MLGGVFAVYAAFGLVSGSTAALVPSIREDLGLTRSQLGLVLGAWQLVYIGASIPGGRLIDRVGLRWSVLASAGCIAASGLLRAFAWDLWSLAASVGLLGVGAPIISIGAPKAAAVLFDGASRRRAVGVYGAAPAFGTTLALATANGVVGRLVGHDWRLVMVVFALGAALAGAFWLYASAGFESRSGQIAGSPMRFTELARVPIVSLILATAVVSFVFVHGLGQWVVDLLQVGGRSAETAGYMASLAAVVGLLATVALPRFATRDRRRTMFGVLLFGGAVATLGVTSAADSVALPALMMSTVARVSVLPIAMLVLMDHPRVGPTNMAGAGSLFFTAAQFGGVSGPLVTGWLADADPTFGAAVAFHAGVMVAVGLLLVVGLGRLDNPRRPRSA